MCGFPGRLSDDNNRGHQQQASGKRQGTKSRAGGGLSGYANVEDWAHRSACAERYWKRPCWGCWLRHFRR